MIILGLGESGLAAADLALMQGTRLTILDSDASPQLEERAGRLRNRGVEVLLDYTDDRWERNADLAVISPGIANESSLGRLAESLDCPVVSELEFAYRHCACPLLAVTGTNGKTTTVELVVHCLRGAGKKVLGAGNLGPPLSEAARKSATLDLIVAEVSSFQLERIDRFAPYAAALLNVSDDHLDRYPNRDAYLQAKLRLFANVPHADKIVLHQRLWQTEAVRAALPPSPPEPLRFAADPDGKDADFFLDDEHRICRRTAAGPQVILARDELKLRGDHNIENALSALAMCEIAGVEPAVAGPLLKTFAPSAHRLELVTVHNGVTYIDDSKATNPDAVIQALRTCQAIAERRQGKILLIAGGRDKKMDFAAVKPFLTRYVKGVLLIGEAKTSLAEQWSDAVPCRKFASMAAAAESAIEAAEPGDVVLLSPGCASQDMFVNYAERGNTFSKEVNRRLEG